MKLISVRCSVCSVLVLSSVFVLHLNHPPRMISSYCGANTPREKRCISGKVCVVLGARSASKNPWKHVGRILLTQNRTDVATARPSYRHHARARSKMAMGCRHGGDTRLPPSSITLRPRCSLGSGRIDNCGALSRGAVRLFSDGPSPQCRQSGWSLSHCSTNSTAPYKACTGSSSSSSHRPSSFRARQRSWPAVAAVGSSPRAAAGAGSSRPGEASGSPAGAEGSTGSAGGSSWRCWMRVVNSALGERFWVAQLDLLTSNERAYESLRRQSSVAVVRLLLSPTATLRPVY